VTFKGHFGDLLTLVTLCAQLTRDLLAIAEFLGYTLCREKSGPLNMYKFLQKYKTLFNYHLT